MRGDVTLGSEQHPSELGLETITPDRVLGNDGTLERLMNDVRTLLSSLFQGNPQ
jgi:hypothetical protein